MSFRILARHSIISVGDRTNMLRDKVVEISFMRLFYFQHGYPEAIFWELGRFKHLCEKEVIFALLGGRRVVTRKLNEIESCSLHHSIDRIECYEHANFYFICTVKTTAITCIFSSMDSVVYFWFILWKGKKDTYMIECISEMKRGRKSEFVAFKRSGRGL